MLWEWLMLAPTVFQMLLAWFFTLLALQVPRPFLCWASQFHLQVKVAFCLSMDEPCAFCLALNVPRETLTCMECSGLLDWESMQSWLSLSKILSQVSFQNSLLSFSSPSNYPKHCLGHSSISRCSSWSLQLSCGLLYENSWHPFVLDAYIPCSIIGPHQAQWNHICHIPFEWLSFS